jgi:serine protease Do
MDLAGCMSLTSGTPLLITNKHVINQASFALVRFEDINGNEKLFSNIPIIFVDDVMDLAVLGLPSNSFQTGIPLDLDRTTDGTHIFAVGFPGFGAQPLWQFSMGTVSNAAAQIDQGHDYLIQHTASIDTGNSGGPLLIQSDESDLGYAVVGVNTLKAIDRSNTSFAHSIPRYTQCYTQSRRSA